MVDGWVLEGWTPRLDVVKVSSLTLWELNLCWIFFPKTVMGNKYLLLERIW